MTEQRNSLTIDAVLDRFAATEQVLAEAARRVHDLGDASEVADRASSSLVDASRSVTTAAEQLAAVTAAMQAAQTAFVDAMTIASRFLETTDVSQVLAFLQAIFDRVAALEAATAKTQEQLGALQVATDRAAAMERERDEVRRRLDAVMAQLPPRVAKKIH